MDAQAREQQACQERSHNADDKVTHHAKAGPLHNLTGEPTSDNTNQQDDRETFNGHWIWPPEP